MAKKGASGEPQPPVVVAVFEDLIKRLEPASVDAAVTGRLRQALVDDQETSVDALRSALFSEEPLP